MDQLQEFMLEVVVELVDNVYQKVEKLDHPEELVEVDKVVEQMDQEQQG